MIYVLLKDNGMVDRCVIVGPDLSIAATIVNAGTQYFFLCGIA